MITYGNKSTNELVSVILDEDGNLKTFATGEEIPEEEKQNLIPLVKLPAPAFDAETEECEPSLNWFEDRVERDWVIVPIAANKKRSNMRSALRQQWEALPSYIRGPYRDKFEAANRFLDEGDDESAIALIEYATAMPDFTAEQVLVFESTKQTFKTAIENLTKI